MFKERWFKAKTGTEEADIKWRFYIINLNCLKNKWDMEIAGGSTYRGIFYEG